MTLNLFFVPSLRVSGSRNKHRKKFKKDKSADKKKGALTPFLNKFSDSKQMSILCIGDGLTTDIRGANNEKHHSLLVVGGLLKKKHLIEAKNNTILDERKLNRTIEDNKVHVDYAIKFFR